ncbi:hypothetical protein O3M35_002583 [Rhynocoris fuscipes]|uniref:Odorant receptor n=1 Tax=Rhynocoris fuscipes TaxID=488301 RepID=A0AAW1CMA1_9HEMI
MSKTKEIRSLLDRLESIREIMLNDEINRHFVIDAENFGRPILRMILLTFLGYIFSAFLLNFLIGLITNFKQKNLFVKVWLPWSRETVLVHILSNVLILILTPLFFCSYASFYYIEITFTLYISAYIKTLQNNLVNKGIRNEGIYEQHKVIIQLIREFNELLSGQMYIETVIAPLMPCGYGLMILKAAQKREIAVVIDNFARGVIVLTPAFISCGCGQEIIMQMETLHEATYMSNWYQEEPKIIRDLLIMMIRTTSETTINYRLFVRFDYNYLSAVLKLIYSYFMLMVNLDEN